MRRITCFLGSAVLLLAIQAFSQPGQAQTVYLSLTIDGNDVEGASTVLSMDREGTIPCHSFSDGFEGAYEASTVEVRVISRPTFKPIVCTKRLDQSAPLAGTS